MTAKTRAPSDATVPWLRTKAVVTGCHYEFARLNTLTLGIAADSTRFLISFTYYAHARTLSGEFTSPVAMAQGTSFLVFYNPLNPQENRPASGPGASGSAMASRAPLLSIGIAGSIVISLVYLGMMHGCN